MAPMDAALLPEGVRSRFIEGVNGLRMHVLESGDPAAPCVLLLHGFPELAYSWRAVLPLLGAAGYYAVAPDLRGYGLTAERVVGFDEDLAPYRMSNRLVDALCLVAALGRQTVALVGHDYGSWVAGYCALARPDVFTSVVLMSAPFGGAPSLAAVAGSLRAPSDDPIHAALAGLARPRVHYHAYFASRQAAGHMDGSEAQVARFLRAYYHFKSGDLLGNDPYELAGWTAEALAGMPTYYVMNAGRTMPETVASEMPADGGVGCGWLTPFELAVYAAAYARTGFQGPLQGYRVRMDGSLAADLAGFAGRRVEVPALFVAGARDWGPYQGAGGMGRMMGEGFVRMEACELVEGAGHWVQQEAARRVGEVLVAFLGRVSGGGGGGVLTA